MDKQEIIEGNKLICEFMGLKWLGETHISDKYTDMGVKDGPFEYEADYHSSWDWLMPVVEKIQSIEVTPPPNYSGYRIEIVVQGFCKIEGPFPFRTLFKNVSNCGSLINAVWQLVVEFIVYHNSQKQ